MWDAGSSNLFPLKISYFQVISSTLKCYASGAAPEALTCRYLYTCSVWGSNITHLQIFVHVFRLGLKYLSRLMHQDHPLVVLDALQVRQARVAAGRVGA